MVDNGLFNFKLNNNSCDTTSRPYIKTINRTPGRWIKPGESIEIGQYKITGGFVYFGGQLKSLDRFYVEASLINPDLKVNYSNPDKSGSLMGYWPNYSTICPECRAAYLEWLSSDRSDPDINIGYIFLYFYGIERRLIIKSQKDIVTKEEFICLQTELYRLKNLYGSNRSFNTHVTNLLSYIIAIYPGFIDDKIDWDITIGYKKFTHALRYILAENTEKGLPVGGNLALLWLRAHPDHNLKIPAIRCYNMFNNLFKVKFNKIYENGLIITGNKKRLKIIYNPSSSTLKNYKVKEFDLPDVCRLKSPFKKISDISDLCISELEAYSRYIGREENSKDSFDAISLLPKDIISNYDNPIFQSLKNYIDENINENLLSLDKLYTFFNEEKPVNLVTKDVKKISRILDLCGWGMVPDPLYFTEKIDINSTVAIFPGGYSNFTSTSNFIFLYNLIRLCYSVTKLTNDQELFIQNLMQEDKILNEIDIRILQSYLIWCNNTCNVIRIKSLNTFSEVELKTLCYNLIDIVLIKGKISTEEIKKIENIYKVFKLENNLITSDIHNRSVRLSRNSSIFYLDENLLEKHEKDTEEVKIILDTIFIEDEKQTIDIDQNTAISGLDKKHSNLLNILLEKEKWIRNDVILHCKQLGLMLNGAIEVINDWSFDIVDAPLIEDGNTVFLDLDIYEELKLEI